MRQGGSHENSGWSIAQMAGSSQIRSLNWAPSLATSVSEISDQKGWESTLRLSRAWIPLPSITAVYLAPMVTRCWVRMLAWLSWRSTRTFWHN